MYYVFKKELVLEYFKIFKERIKKERIFKRELKVNFLKDKIVSIVGPRRAGKTFYMFYLMKQLGNSIYLDLESSLFNKLEENEIIEIVKLYEEYFNEKVYYIFLDEVQSLKNWQSALRTLLGFNYFLLVSGSSSKLLPKELSTKLRGRSLSYLLLPFSLKELLEVNGIELKKEYSLSDEIKIRKILEDCLTYGCYPEVVLNKENREKILSEYYDTIFFRDFVERHGIKSIEVAKTIFEYLFQNFSREISPRKIQDYIVNNLNINTKVTIFKYLDSIQDTLVVFFLEKYSQSVYKRRTWPRKAYVVDVGLSTIVSPSLDFGRRMENFVFLELKRRENLKPTQRIYYWRDTNGNEVDFVVKDGPKIEKLIQVTYASSKDEVEKREIKALMKLSEQLKCKDLLIITWNYEDKIEIEDKNIKFLPLWKWLIQQ